MIEQKFTLKDLQQLDPISYDEIDSILNQYELKRTQLARQLRRLGDNAYEDVHAYEIIDSFLGELYQSKDVRKRRAILAQMREENCGKVEVKS